MKFRLNLRLFFLLAMLAWSVTCQLSKEHRPSLLNPGVKMHAYVTDVADGSVVVVDLVSLEVVARISVGGGPSGLRAHPTRPEVWGVSSANGHAWVIDTRSGQVVARIPLGAAPFAVEFSPDGTRAYVAASGSGSVVAIDCETRQVIARAQPGKRPWLARVAPDGKLLVVTLHGDDAVILLDAATLQSLATIPVASQPEQVVILPDSSKAFVAAPAAEKVSVVDLRQRALLANLPVSGLSGVAGTPANLVLKSDGGELYIPSPGSHGLTIVNTWTNEIADFVLLGSAPGRATLTADDETLYVTDAAAGRVTPVRIRFRRALRPVSVGRLPGVCRLSPAPREELLLVVNESSGDLAVIRTHTHSLVTMIPVGQQPRDLAIKVF
jgi:YVTN family beta-propeller protein